MILVNNRMVSEEAKTSVKKICFNPSCNEIGTHWINIVGRFGGYEGGLVPYLVCDKCNSFLGMRENFIQGIKTMIEGKSKNVVVEVEKIGIDIQSLNPFTAERMITTKDLHELVFQSGMEMEDIEERNPELKQHHEPIHIICYNKECNNEGAHDIDILNPIAVFADHEIEYCLCNECYSFFDYKRKETPVKLDINKIELDIDKLETTIIISPFTFKEIITTRDLYRLLEKSNLDKEDNNKK